MKIKKNILILVSFLILITGCAPKPDPVIKAIAKVIDVENVVEGPLDSTTVIASYKEQATAYEGYINTDKQEELKKEMLAEDADLTDEEMNNILKFFNEYSKLCNAMGNMDPANVTGNYIGVSEDGGENLSTSVFVFKFKKTPEDMAGIDFDFLTDFLNNSGFYKEINKPENKVTLLYKGDTFVNVNGTLNEKLEEIKTCVNENAKE